ncbi:MAG: DUF1700 domain-containing protein [Oscillospiraceae bacterium]
MVAQNKDDFLFQLHNELHRIGVDADEEIFSDFEEHFKASSMEGISEEETCRRLGDVKEIARSYINIESSRLNSIVAQAIESDRPHVSLTKPGRDVPADLSLVKSKPANEAEQTEEQTAQTDNNSEAKEEPQETPIREYTPEHLSEEIYPETENRSAHIDLSKPVHTEENKSESAPEASETANGSAEAGTAGTAGESTAPGNNGEANGNNSEGQSVADAIAAAGAAVASAASSAGHAIAEAFGSDSMKDAGRSAAEAIKTAGHATAEAIKNAAEAAKAEHEQNKAQAAREQDRAQDITQPSDSFREKNTESRRCDIPAQEGQEQNIGKGFKFTDLKGMKMNPNFGKLFGAILMDFLLWSWLICMLGSIAIGLLTGGIGTIGTGCGVIFAGTTGFFLISRIFLGVGIISLGVIIFLLGMLLVKGIIGMIKKIVMMHVKALYDI